MRDVERTYIICNITDTSIKVKGTAAALVSKAIREEMDKVSRVETFKAVIEAIADLPLFQRYRILGEALEVITDEMNVLEIITIIQNKARDFPYPTPFIRLFHDVDLRPVNIFDDRFIRLFHDIDLRAVDIFNDRIVAEPGTAVHEGNRDRQVKAAIALLREDQGEIPQDRIEQAVREFTQYLHDHQDGEHKQLALRALLAPQDGETFGPLIDENDFTILGLKISGEEVIGRLWVFASKLKEPEQTNAKEGIVSGLKDSCSSDGSRVCNPGKVQRLIVSVLQGRLEEVDIELLGTEVSTEGALNMFFCVEAHQKIKQLEPLIEAANRFCEENPLVKRDDFLRKIRQFAELGRFAED